MRVLPVDFIPASPNDTGERAYFRIVTGGVAAYEVFRSEGGAWYLERVID